jgi:hypothetical protein
MEKTEISKRSYKVFEFLIDYCLKKNSIKLMHNVDWDHILLDQSQCARIACFPKTCPDLWKLQEEKKKRKDNQEPELDLLRAPKIRSLKGVSADEIDVLEEFASHNTEREGKRFDLIRDPDGS